MSADVKCKMCRHALIPSSSVVSEHGNSDICNASGKQCIFVIESSYPHWIIDLVQQADWTRGKINCPSCQAKVGWFDFVSNTKCACNQFVLPPVHLVRSKVDYLFR